LLGRSSFGAERDRATCVANRQARDHDDQGLNWQQGVTE